MAIFFYPGLHRPVTEYGVRVSYAMQRRVSSSWLRTGAFHDAIEDGVSVRPQAPRRRCGSKLVPVYWRIVGVATGVSLRR